MEMYTELGLMTDSFSDADFLDPLEFGGTHFD